MDMLNQKLKHSAKHKYAVSHQHTILEFMRMYNAFERWLEFMCITCPISWLAEQLFH